MEENFWLDRWQSKQIGFHQSETHAALREYWASLKVLPAGAVFVPLCGKSRDMLWLRGQGHKVLGVELSPIAVHDFFAENDMTPIVSTDGRFQRYEAEGFTLLCGDFFDVTPSHLAGIAAVYDRAALIALPPQLRERYAHTLRESLPKGAPIFLVTVNYSDDEMKGPPFSVSEAEVHRHFDKDFLVERVSTADAFADNSQLQRGGSALAEQVYRISARGGA